MSYLKKKTLLLKRGPLEIRFEQGWLKIYWQGCELTANSGLTAAINTAGIWADSTYGDWQIESQKRDSIILKNVWKNLPLSCIWHLTITEDYAILWDIDMQTEEHLEIDERRAVVMTSSLYKTWVSSYEEGRFPPIIGWQDMSLSAFSSKIVGVRFSGEDPLKPLVLEFKDNEFGRSFPLIQNTSSDMQAHLIGVKFVDSDDKKTFARGAYKFFSGKISVVNEEHYLDSKIERKRQDFFDSAKRKSKLGGGRKSKVLLVNLPWQSQGRSGVRAGSRWPHIKDISEGNYLPFPFFLSYAASLLRKNDIEADLLDAIAEQIPEDKFIQKLLRKDFDVLVVETSVPSLYYDLGLLKRLSPLGFPTIICGPHPEIYDPRFLEENNFIDFVLFGEYEFTLLELMRSLSQNTKDLSDVAGLVWRDEKNNVIKNAPRPPFDINLLPWPHRQSLPLDKYWDLPGDIPYPSLQMVASRGCPFNCNFCLWPQLLFGSRAYRTRDVKDCIDEMEYMVKTNGFKSVYWDDDTFNVGKSRMLEFCDEIIRRDLQKIPWAIMAKADLMDEEILDAMKKAGLKAVKYGVESASQEIVDKCGKGLDLAKTERIIKYTKSLDIGVHLTFSFGLPGETKDTIKKTIDRALELDPHSVQFSIVTPFPGTRLFEDLDKEGRITTKDWSLYDGHYSCVFRPYGLSSQDLEEAKQYAYRLWADHQRKRRGWLGNAKRFMHCCKKQGISATVNKSARYCDYMLRYRKRFVGKI